MNDKKKIVSDINSITKKVEFSINDIDNIKFNLKPAAGTWPVAGVIEQA